MKVKFSLIENIIKNSNIFNILDQYCMLPPKEAEKGVDKLVSIFSSIKRDLNINEDTLFNITKKVIIESMPAPIDKLIESKKLMMIWIAIYNNRNYDINGYNRKPH